MLIAFQTVLSALSIICYNLPEDILHNARIGGNKNKEIERMMR